MDDRLITEVSRRLAATKKQAYSEQELAALTDALAEAHDIPRDQVANAMQAVLAERASRKSRLVNGLWAVALAAGGGLLVYAGGVLDRKTAPPLAAAPAVTDGYSATANARHFAEQASLANALSAVMPLRMIVAEFQMTNGRYPRDVAEAGLNPADLNGRYVRKVVFGKKGAIVATTTEEAGGHIFALVPLSAMGE